MDTQREQVYNAERMFRLILDRQPECPTLQVFGSTIVVPDTVRRFGSLEHMRVYVEHLWTQPWFLAAFPGVPVPALRKRKYANRAHYEPAGHVIAYPESVMRREQHTNHEEYLLHEVAHAVTRGQRDGAHGARFVGALLYLVRHQISPEAEMILAEQMITSGVKISSPQVVCS